jgi:hypothetical protein
VRARGEACGAAFERMRVPSPVGMAVVSEYGPDRYP